ncbi:hypothetical protein RB195_026300 [Necator americanus]|uniref:Uncharacterized protein n=1 Tax=Necator americanus TaxID=51031 RepID=A0ABR1EWD4_NECAM
MRNPTEGTQMSLEQEESKLEEFRIMMDDLARNVEWLAVLMYLRSAVLKRKLLYRSCNFGIGRAHLRKEEQAKRKLTLDTTDCAQDESDACAVCLRIVA